MLVGSSVHNQHIERLWYDAVTQYYYRVFYYMENCDILSPLSEQHLYALQFVYLPRIKKHHHNFYPGMEFSHSVRYKG